MKYKIGIFGSSAGDMTELIPKAQKLAEALAKTPEPTIIITGACSGVPYEVAAAAAKQGVEVWGFSPMLDEKSQIENCPDDDISIYSKLVYVPKDYEFADNKRARMKFRNVSSTTTCDAGIVISGRWGSLNEFTNLMDLGKVAGVLTGTGGVADELEGLAAKINKEGQGTAIFDPDPEQLVAKVTQALGHQSA